MTHFVVNKFLYCSQLTQFTGLQMYVRGPNHGSVLGPRTPPPAGNFNVADRPVPDYGHLGFG